MNSYVYLDRLKRTFIRSLIPLGIFLLWFVPMEDRAIGTVVIKSTVRSEIRAPIASFLKSVYADEGDSVTVGSLVIELEVPGLDSDISQLQAEIAEVKARLRILGAGENSGDTIRSGKVEEYRAEIDFALKNYKKAKELIKKNLVEDRQVRLLEKEYQVWKSRYQQLLAEQDAERAHLARSQERLRYLESTKTKLQLNSPIDGTIITSDVSDGIGRYFEEGELIIEMVNPAKLEAEVSIPEQDMVHIQFGQNVDLKIFALPYQTINAKVKRIAPVIETLKENDSRQTTPIATANIKIYCELEGVIDEMVPGMTGYARVTLSEQSAGSVLSKRLMRFIRTEFWW